MFKVKKGIFREGKNSGDEYWYIIEIYEIKFLFWKWKEAKIPVEEKRGVFNDKHAIYYDKKEAIEMAKYLYRVREWQKEFKPETIEVEPPNINEKI